MCANCVLRLVVLVLIGLLAVPVFATDYTFTKITDDAPGSTLGAFASFLGPFLINSSGAVAFTTRPNNGNTSVYTGSGNGIALVFEGAVDFNTPRLNWATGFNDSGIVVFQAGGGIYTSTAGGTRFQVDAQTGGSALLPAINNAGTVAYGIGNTTIMTRTGTAAAHNAVERYRSAQIERSLCSLPIRRIHQYLRHGGLLCQRSANRPGRL